MLENNYKQLIIKQSKFNAYFYQVSNLEQVNDYLMTLKKENPKARHICYAYRIGNDVKYSDDGEPHGTAGKPIYHIINMNQLDNVLIVVVRYFGDVKLGSGPLTRAYLKAAKEVINQISN